MDDVTLARVARYAPPWVRYLLTASEIARSGEGWVVSSGDDIAVIEIEDRSAMPLWPYRFPAERAADGGDAEANAIELRDLMEGVLPALAANEVSVVTFPSGTDFASTPESFARDLAMFVEEPRDIAGALERGPAAAKLESPLELETPDMSDANNADETGGARFWMLKPEGARSVIGGLVGGEPALALFVTQEVAEEFATALPRPAVPMPVSSHELIGRWLLLAFSGDWGVAVVGANGADEVGFVSPARMALDLAEERARP
jgi:hypothetical protein